MTTPCKTCGGKRKVDEGLYEIASIVPCPDCTEPATHPAVHCQWSEGGDGCWHSSCEKVFWFEDGGPDDSGFKFCPYCGKPCVEVEWATGWGNSDEK